MMIPSSLAAKLCGVSRNRFHQLARLLKLKEQSVPRPSSRRCPPERCWSLSQISALLMLPQLCRLRVDEEVAANFCRKFAVGSDEGWEHSILTGRRWALIAGSGIGPDVLPRESARTSSHETDRTVGGFGHRAPASSTLAPRFLELLTIAQEAGRRCGSNRTD